MKKVFISLIMAGTLFTACSSEDASESQDQAKGVGSVNATITFDQTETKADPALSKAIPLTSWKNIKQVQMFLYEPGTKKVVYASDELNPYNNGGTPETNFKWTNIPVGTYDLALVANTKSGVNSIVTYTSPTLAAQWGQYNVKDKMLNTDLFMKLASATLPASHTSMSAAHAAQKGNAVPSEVFTAYATGVQITDGVINTLATPLKLKREVSLLRVRINRTAIAAGVDFNGAGAAVLVQRQPQKLGVLGGIVAGTANDVNELLVGGTGATTLKISNPTAADYSNNTQMLTTGFTLWNDVVVFPNVPVAEITDPVASSKQYIIRVSALAPVGYTPQGATTPLTTPTVVWWYGYIPHAFTANTIREINLTITSPGEIIIPPVPQPQGGLIINLTAPADWNANIERSDLEL